MFDQKRAVDRSVAFFSPNGKYCEKVPIKLTETLVQSDHGADAITAAAPFLIKLKGRIQ